jgi:hypothetical protein
MAEAFCANLQNYRGDALSEMTTDSATLRINVRNLQQPEPAPCAVLDR